MLDNAQPKYLEQLIPHTILAHYNISTLTPIETKRTLDDSDSHWHAKLEEPYILVNYKADDIKRALVKYKVPHNDTDEMISNIRHLENYAKKMGRKLLWNKKSTEQVEHEKSQKPETVSQAESQGQQETKPKRQRKVSKTKASL